MTESVGFQILAAWSILHVSNVLVIQSEAVGSAKGSLRPANGSLCFSPSGLRQGGSATEKR